MVIAPKRYSTSSNLSTIFSLIKGKRPKRKTRARTKRRLVGATNCPQGTGKSKNRKFRRKPLQGEDGSIVTEDFYPPL